MTVKTFFLVWAGLWSKPTRTLFTLVSLAVGFLLFGLLQGLNTAFANATSRTQADRLLLSPKFENPLPQSYLSRLQSIPGVSEVTWTGFLPAFFQDPRNGFVVISTDPVSFYSVRNEYKVDPRHLEALLKTRTGLIVFEPLAQRLGWKIGDRITLGSPVPREDGAPWEFDVVGFTTNPSNPGSVPFAIAQYDYVNAARANLKDRVTRFVVRIADARRSVEMAEAIDKVFANSDAPTRSQAENEFAQSDLATIGDVRKLTTAIIGAVFFATLFLVGNVIRQSTRERTSQFGMLKTLGYSDTRVLAIVAGEALLLCLMGALVGLAGTVVMFPMIANYLPNLSGYLGTPRLSGVVLLLGVLAAGVLTILSAAQPALSAMRLNIVDALRMRV
jgi:putative ABC transport system permease protein